MRRGCGDAANFFGESRDSSKLIFECANPRCLRKMTSAASYVTRALLVLGAIMNSLIALKYIAGSKASTVESLGPIGKLFKPCLLYTSPSPRDQRGSRMPSSA